MAQANALNAPIPFSMANGGTGAALTATLGAMPYSTATTFALTAALTNGQIVIGSTGGNPAPGLIIGGTGITVVNGPNTITISVTDVETNWVTVTGTTQTIVAGTSYFANNAALVTFTLPTTSAVGDEFTVVGQGAGGWKVAQNASQLIRIGSSVSTTGTGGSVASTNQYDSIALVCQVANTTWIQRSSPQGNITVT
jgi:hypothetical protein